MTSRSQKASRARRLSARFSSLVVVAALLVPASAEASWTLRQGTDTITPGTSISCHGATSHSLNQYMRRFELTTDHGVYTSFDLSRVTFGIEQANDGDDAGQPVIVRAYRIPTAASLTMANLTQIASTEITVQDAEAGNLRNVPFAATLADPQANDLVVAIETPSGQAANNLLYLGANAGSETRPSYLRATGCGAFEPTPTGSFPLNSPNTHWVIRAQGSLTGARSFDTNTAMPAAIADGTSATAASYGAPTNVTFPVSAITKPIQDVQVELTVSHTYAGDLDVVLIAPDGTTTKTIFSRVGATNAPDTGDNSNLIGAYSFADGASAAPSLWTAAGGTCQTGCVVPPASYRATLPGGAGGTGANTLITPTFAGLSGANVNGTWTLRIRDGASGDTGLVNGAVLSIGQDTTAPAAPVLTGTDPASPANANSFKVTGAAEAGAIIHVYKTADCSGPDSGSAFESTLSGAGMPVFVADDTTTSVTVTATDASGNLSACSAPITYVEDSTAPAAPVLSGTSPASGSNNNSPAILGSADPGSALTVYESADCSGTAAAAGTAADLSGAGIPIAVADNSTTQASATATDAAGNVSVCSAPGSYEEKSAEVTNPDNIAPKTTLNPVKAKIKTKKPKARVAFTFSANEPGRFVCSLDGAPDAPCSSPTELQLKKGSHTFKVTAIDEVGNRDATPAEAKFRVVRKRKR